jgi:hypothetical protein
MENNKDVSLLGLRSDNDWLTAHGLMSLFYENYNYLRQNGVYEREEITWNEKDKYYFDSQYIDYMEEWITKRLQFLDGAFNLECARVGI